MVSSKSQTIAGTSQPTMDSSILEVIKAHINTTMQKNKGTVQHVIDYVQKNETTMQNALTEIRKDMETMQTLHQTKLQNLHEQHREDIHAIRHEIQH